MKEIKLTQGKFAKVDDEDYEKLAQHKWYTHKVLCQTSKEVLSYYARRHYMDNGIKKSIYMHRQILNITDKTILVDHKDFDTLNNQKSNIRTGNKSNNGTNRKPVGTSKYLGVSIHRQRNRKGDVKVTWKAQYTITKGKRKYIGTFPFTENGEIQAAKAYDKEAKNTYGEFANLNFPNEV